MSEKRKKRVTVTIDEELFVKLQCLQDHWSSVYKTSFSSMLNIVLHNGINDYWKGMERDIEDQKTFPSIMNVVG